MYLSLPNPYFYAIRSIKIFLKVLNKVNSECLNKPRLFLTIELLPFAKLLELSAINHGLSERRIIFFLVVEVLPCSGCFINYIGVHFPVIELDNTIWCNTLSRMLGFLWHSFKWACQFGHFLQYMSEIKVLACSLDIDLNYMTTMLQLHPSLNH